MRRTFSVLILMTLVTGCGALHGALPYRTTDFAGLTVEQYAINRLGTPPSRPAKCSKRPLPARQSHQKRCPAK